jgi:RNA polymerase sigma factor (sigma-70 family)
MTSVESVALVRQAKAGDRKAWDELCARYYPKWLSQFHGDVGKRLRGLYDTADLVQSALGSVLKDLGDLRNEGSFFAWVSAIIRHKIAQKAKRGKGRQMVSLDEVREPEESGGGVETVLVSDEQYLQLLDAILALFPAYEDAMAAVFLRYFEQMDMAALVRTFEKDERSVQRLLSDGRKLLRSRLSGL